MIKEFFTLLFPKFCFACHRPLISAEEDILCLQCQTDLPYTDFNVIDNNHLKEKLATHLPNFDKALAMFYFRKDTRVQTILHHLKYDNKPEIGYHLGQIYAHRILSTMNAIPWTIIIPVPLHIRRLKERGYNQCDLWAEGLADVFDISFSGDLLIRQKYSDTQTKKARVERIRSLQDTFAIRDSSRLINQHVLLVDDVVTTGSTLIACGQTLLKAGVNSVSVAVIAAAT